MSRNVQNRAESISCQQNVKLLGDLSMAITNHWHHLAYVDSEDHPLAEQHLMATLDRLLIFAICSSRALRATVPDMAPSQTMDRGTSLTAA